LATVYEYLLPIATRYVLGGSQYEPYDTDCSGMVTAGFYKVYGIEPPPDRAWTGSMWASPDSDLIYQGTSPDLPWDEMEVDDLIFTSVYSPDFDTVNGSHVGVYTGNPDLPLLSHFADGGPYQTSLTHVYAGNERYFGVKRMKGVGDMTLNEWMYKELSTPYGNTPMWELLSWSYTYSRNADSQIRELKKQLDAANAKIDAMNAKLDAIISKVGK